ncbi:MAG: butyrate kinase [Bacteroidia bacterium]|nr:butyrate kinase [Bacteroidia bacterium]
MNYFNILVVNPKDKFTQIAAYENQKLVYLVNLKHPADILGKFKRNAEQVKYRADAVIEELNNNGIVFSQLKYVIARGGLLRPVSSGLYSMNEMMIEDLTNSPVGEDIVNIGGLIADDISSRFPGVTAVISDPATVDELEDVARLTGHPNFSRRSVFHALSQKAVAITHAKSYSRNYEDMNLIVAHLGNGTSIGAHQKGRVIDITQGFDGDGPFSMIRSGSLPIGDVIRMCYSGKFEFEEMMCLVTHCGGIYSHLGTTNINEIDKRIEEGDKKATLVMEAMAYQVAKYIGAMYAILNCEVDAILLTGEIAHSNFVVKQVVGRVQKMAPTLVYPGDNNISALASNALRLLKGEITLKEYKF